MQQKLIAEILAITAKIQEEFPELYKNLRETPLSFSHTDKDTDTIAFKDYLESLKTQLADFEKAEHKNKI